jgi:DNA processing protein
MALSLVCEPGDPRLPGLLSGSDPVELLTSIRSGRIGGTLVPAAWQHAVRSVDRELERVTNAAADAGLRWVIPGDRAWPDRLDDLNHLEAVAGATGAPLGLWVRGAGSLAKLVAKSVAIVGARDCTAYGAELASELAADVASAGFTVVSGAAFGVDASAHRGALVSVRPTIAVLACDAATDYPRAHTALLRRIADEGLVVSEQPPGQVPTKARFLSRNRLIAALTQGTVVVEARRRSGSLNTLGWADQLGRPAMAVPGPVTSQNSVGTHQAIRDGRAILVTSGMDVASELSGFVAEPHADPIPDTAFDRLTRAESRALDALVWRQPLGIGEVAHRSGLSPEVAGRALATLVARGFALGEPSGWVLLRRADLESP